MSDVFDAAESKALRDEGMQRVADNGPDFMATGMQAIASLPGGFEYTGEKIREHLLAKKIEPHHHNAWGALICSAVRRGLLEETGRYVPMTARRSHARKTQVYKK